MQNNKNKNPFLLSTAKDFDLSYERVETVYTNTVDLNEFFKKLEEISSLKNNEE